MHTRSLKYISPFLVYALAVIAFTGHGVLCWLALIYAWFIIPFLELFIKPDHSNMEQAEEELAKHDRVYDYILYAIVPAQFVALALFLFSMKEASPGIADIAGRVYTMGLLCGSFGINVGHELGHRSNKAEQALAKTLLLSSLYMHFFIEHNKGHHKKVATKEDPASARLWETVYIFYMRSAIMGYLNAWKISAKELGKKQLPILNFKNEMLQMQLIQLLFVAFIFFIFGWQITLYFFMASVIGMALLETVNYIEHYGLTRNKLAGDKYERTMPQHSWNSDHIIGRLMLFELSRHSDHHYLASRKYQVLRHHNNSPQMPTGYPGMMILSLIPPLWFYVMHKQMRRYDLQGQK